jgi:hypothetical protein
LDDLSRQRPGGVDSQKMVLHYPLAQGFATIRMGRPSFGVVAAMAKFRAALVLRPKFDQRIHPQVEMIDGKVRPDVYIVAVLLDRGAIDKCFQDADDAGIGVGETYNRRKRTSTINFRRFRGGIATSLHSTSG